ncbi:MAG: DUF1552 domain-containing protein [Deltaproteobacteria bacterium]|nr:DUF1552 domain-containing protein [Deltaproteobacteria bacterium]
MKRFAGWAPWLVISAVSASCVHDVAGNDTTQDNEVDAEHEEGPDEDRTEDQTLPVKPDASRAPVDAASNGKSDTAVQDTLALPADAGPAASPPTPPLRLAVVVTLHGVAAETFWPVGNGTSVSYEGSLKPLQRFSNRLLQVKGIDMDPSPTSLSQDDSNYVRLLLTGKVSIPAPLGYPQYRAEAASLDVLFARASSKESACFVPKRSWAGLISPFWNGPGVPLRCAEDIESWARTLGTTTSPGHADDDPAFDSDDIPRSLKLGAEALAKGQILAMGTTVRVSEARARGMGLPDLHSMLHYYGDRDKRPYVLPSITRYNLFQAQRVADLATAIESQKAEDGSSLLDHTLIIWMSALGPDHDLKDIPVVILGDAHGALRGAGFANVGRRSIKDLLATLAKALRIPESSYPPSGVGASPISTLLR